MNGNKQIGIFIGCVMLWGWGVEFGVSFAAEYQSGAMTHVVPGELLVKFKSTVPRRNKSHLRAKMSAYLNTRLYSSVEHWVLPDNAMAQQTLEQLKQDPDVLFVEPNYRRYPRKVTIDPRYQDQKNRLEQINLPAAWDITTGSTEVIVAVIDDAFDIRHPDLQQNIFAPRDFVNNDNDPSPEFCENSSSLEFHGTTVAGVLGAIGENGIGIAGAAWDVSLMPIRIGCNYSVAQELLAIEWAIQNGAHIINISYGGPQYSEAERDAIFDLQGQDILLVTAAGNSDVNNDKVPDYPSGLALPNILAVAAVDANDDIAEWSQYGAVSVDIAAPGVDVLTTAPRSHGIAGCAVQNIYCVLDGTSYSAPFVSGVAALLKSAYPQATFRDLKGAIMASAVRLNTQGRLAVDGRVDAHGALIAMENKQPVVVIAGVEIDDSAYASGNNNGVVDPGETFDIVLTLENVWQDANGLRVELVSSLLNISAYNPQRINVDELLSGARRTIKFAMQIDRYVQYTKIPFSVLIEGRSNAKRFSIDRYFELEFGALENGRSVMGVIRKVGDAQDDFHYYHVNVGANAKNLRISLTVTDIDAGIANLDLLVKYQLPPLFDYLSYANGGEGVNAGTIVSARQGIDESLLIPNPNNGTYHIIVLPSQDMNRPNVQYRITAGYEPQSISVAGGGCRLSSKHSFVDPSLFIVILILVVARRLVKSKDKIHWSMK